MKRTIIRLAACVFSIIGSISNIGAQEALKQIIQLEYSNVETSRGMPRTPVYIPHVDQEGYTLYFHDETDFTVNLYSVDEDGERTLEYTTFVPASTESITLPSNLTGTYVIEVIRGSQHFEGEIEL